jgi:hypothetical protein
MNQSCVPFNSISEHISIPSAFNRPTRLAKLLQIRLCFVILEKAPILNITLSNFRLFYKNNASNKKRFHARERESFYLQQFRNLT